MNLWNTLLITPLTTALLFLYQNLGQSLGVAIIALTVILRLLLFPLVLPSLRSAKAQRELQPELKELKKKHKDDKQALAAAQMKLFKKKGVNPFAGCLPQILQLVVLIALYRVFMSNLSDGVLNHQFLIWDLSKRDSYFILPLLAAATQFLLSRMMLPAVSEEEEAAKATKEQADDFATTMQKQNLYLFPVLTLLLGLQFPSGLMLYWLVSSAIQVLQQWLAVRIL